MKKHVWGDTFVDFPKTRSRAKEKSVLERQQVYEIIEKIIDMNPKRGLDVYFIYLTGLRFEDAKLAANEFLTFPKLVHQSKGTRAKYAALPEQFYRLADAFDWQSIYITSGGMRKAIARVHIGATTNDLKHAWTTHSRRAREVKETTLRTVNRS